MKKLFSIILCVVFVFVLSACANDKAKGDLDIDIEYYAKLGQISNIEYKLGDNVDDIKKSLSAIATEDGESPYNEIASGEYTIMSANETSCCYKTNTPDNGITHIIKYGEAYGFYTGAVSTQVRDTMSDMGYESKIRAAKNNELFFLPGGNMMSVLEYQIKDNTVLFAFFDDALSATVIYQK